MPIPSTSFIILGLWSLDPKIHLYCLEGSGDVLSIYLRSMRIQLLIPPDVMEAHTRLRRPSTAGSHSTSTPSVSAPKLSRNDTRRSARQKINYRFDLARVRLEKYQKRWSEIGQELPPQINRSTGLYIGTATALQHAGPLGTLLGYVLTGTVVWPNVGGPVGLAGLYVDPALGFALGTEVRPSELQTSHEQNLPQDGTLGITELSAAAILFNGFFPDATEATIRRSNLIAITVLLFLAIGINCFGARAYGEAEFLFSCFKILTIIVLIITGIIIDLGGSPNREQVPSMTSISVTYCLRRFIGFKNWRNPGPFIQYRGIKGSLGKFLGVWSSMIQAVFAFFGTEVPGVAAGEMIESCYESRISMGTEYSSRSKSGLDTDASPILHARRLANFLISSTLIEPYSTSWQYSSRACCTNNGTSPGNIQVYSSPFVIAIQKSGIKGLAHICNAAFVISAFSAAVSDARCGHAPKFCAGIFRSEHNKTVIPWVGVLVSASFAMLAYMSVSESTNAIEAKNAFWQVFHWLSSLNTTTALLAWIGMVFTYLRWYQGTLAAEKRDPTFKARHSEDIYKNRYRLQPWIAVYGFVMCVLILIFNGWYVFTRDGPWRMETEAWEIGDGPVPDQDIGNWVPLFVSSYLAIVSGNRLNLSFQFLKAYSLFSCCVSWDISWSTGNRAS
ncbi:hypothetical protein CVT26_015870 [Gymnopilus dilepis]|uniref:Amino acid permease/ SLC12A domain-containing protein n=1 Tax=Gymnopilus dilepis TaxID=231916 RepID=A0A409XY95_9AGAR|nr:hypothetical protein CVT26_015870 [Gymnopilus dilepis]